MRRFVGSLGIVLGMGVPLTMLMVLLFLRPASAEPLGLAVARCAPHIAPRTALAIISVESGGRWWAVNDNDRPTPAFASPTLAIAYAEQRVAEGGNIDLGLTQLNSSHLRAFHVSVAEAFAPCTNIALGMNVLQGAWAQAQSRWGMTREALYHAFEAYNGGEGVWRSSNAAIRAKVAHYADMVWDTAIGLAPIGVATPAPSTVPARVRRTKAAVTPSHGPVVFFRAPDPDGSSVWKQ